MSKINEARVFVYGTLKKGHGNHPALHNATFLGRCVLEGDFTIVNLGWFPGVIQDNESGNGGKVYGEVYSVNRDILNTLDMIEGHPSFYERVKVKTPWKNTWVYVLPKSYLADHEVVKTGCWEPKEDEKEYYDTINQPEV